MVWRFISIFVLFVAVTFGLGHYVSAQDANKRFITVYDRGLSTVFLTKAKTIGEALKAEKITLNTRDTVEPAVNQELVASEYNVNIYRARPVVVVDGNIRIKTTSAHQTAQQIAKDVGITIYDEDVTTLQPSNNILRDGASLELTIKRANTITLDLYGNKIEVRTTASTVGEMLSSKHINLNFKSHVSVPLSTHISSGMEVRVWREGVQTIAVDQAIPTGLQIIYDGDRPLGYRAVQTAGVPGIRSITYQVEVKDGVEISRVEIANIVTRRPTTQTEIIGLYNDGRGLTKGKGAQFVTDSKGVSHRETYYDLDMGVVMQACGQGGHYTVRPDGVKVDAQGYVIVAANFGIYPRG
jgi:uncharacterized protein YabE (DUF348 family)